ncbi:hypothetical protein O3G_MSEX013431, partial [Manduca sexta]
MWRYIHCSGVKVDTAVEEQMVTFLYGRGRFPDADVAPDRPRPLRQFLFGGGIYAARRANCATGKFNVAVTKFEVCKGPKSKDCVLITGRVENRTRIYYNMNVLEKMAPTNGKILTTSNNNEIMRLHMNKPCDHLFIRPILHMVLNVTKNCVILQGNYTFYLNFQDIFEKYYGGSFLYGAWTFKSIMYG